MTSAIALHRSEVGDFLVDYTSWLWSSGATCIRIEKNVGRISQAFGLETDITIMPKHIQLCVTSTAGGGCREVLICPMKHCGISFSVNADLSRLSWEIADGKIDFDGARRSLRRIVGQAPTPPLQVLMLTSLANASFCRLFGGDAVAMLVVFIATLAGFRLKQMMLARGRDVRLTFFICAFVSAAISAGAGIFGWGATPSIAMATSVLYLIPGVPYINAVSDLIDRHYLCAFSRFVDASVLTACLSAGLCLAMFIFGSTNWF